MAIRDIDPGESGWHYVTDQGESGWQYVTLTRVSQVGIM